MNTPSLGTCPGLDLAFFQAHENFKEGGTILEFGVGGGYSYSWMAWWIKNHCITDKLVGFDSWAGLPKETKGVWFPEFHREGNYKHDKMWVIEKCKKLGVDIESEARFQFVDGFLSETLTPELRAGFDDVILINSDIDLHSSALDWMNWVVPLLRPGVIIYTDDWWFPNEKSAKEKCGVSLAFEDWYKLYPKLKLKELWSCPTSQRYFEVVSC